MPRLAREALVTDALNPEPPTPPASWSPGRPPSPRLNVAPNDRQAAQDRQTRLTRTLEIDIIPRLVNVHRAVPHDPTPDSAGALPPSTQDVEDFVQLVLAREHVPAQAFIELLVSRGTTAESLYLDLLAPAARHLNYLWTQDLCDFTQVTLGLARLQRLLHELSPSLGADQPRRTNARRVLLMPACGEQQTFGLSMVAEFFHHAGWEVDCGCDPRDGSAIDVVRGSWFDIVGLSVGSETRLESLRSCIHAVRLSSRNKEIGILVGGPIFAGHPERVKWVGADASGLDGKQAPAHAERLIALRHPNR